MCRAWFIVVCFCIMFLYYVSGLCFWIMSLEYVSGLCFWMMFLDYVPGLCVVSMMFLDYVPGLCSWILFLDYVAGLCSRIMFLDYVAGFCSWITCLYFCFFTNHYTAHPSSRTCSQLNPYPNHYYRIEEFATKCGREQKRPNPV